MVWCYALLVSYEDTGADLCDWHRVVFLSEATLIQASHFFREVDVVKWTLSSRSDPAAVGGENPAPQLREICFLHVCHCAVYLTQLERGAHSDSHVGKGPFPGILDTYILKGGPFELRAALLAKKGFAVLALAYQNYQDLPKKADKFHLEYFEEGLDFLRRQPEVKGQKIGLLSISKSGDLALSMSTFLPDITATVWINGCNANSVVPLYYKHMCIPPLMFDLKKKKPTASGLVDMLDVMNDPMSKEGLPTVIPIERAPASFMFIASEDDMNWRSVYHAKLACDRLKAHGKNNYELVKYEKAGHFIEVPYMPFCLATFHVVLEQAVLFGGEPKAHSEAQVDAWQRVIRFFKKTLSS
ncbi:acyl-coenzyme A thioesterase 6-like isoform X2 [Danio aesculapii]|uniref:acyl-coenzyme A thioesterase 6-like isoform X2 n=1 Tax=Danio aesculapii TaxID=1142201 RepID=UPI0024C0CA81|nr:acyl-coenzyme A thioesterase 6-like isoform X2 [Danio aesculapii]